MKKIALKVVYLLITIAVVAVGALLHKTTGYEGEKSSDFDRISEEKTAVYRAEVSDENDLILPEQEQLLQQYALLYGQTLVELEPQDISGLYIDAENEEYYLNKTALEVLTTVRNMSAKDLKLEECSVNYSIADAYTDNGKTYISVLEDNTQKFSFMDKVSQSFIIQHEFVLEQSDGKWGIKSHSHEEDFYLLAAEAWENFSGTPAEISEKVVDAIVEDTEENIGWAEQNYLNKSEDKAALDTSYDRQAAIEYANSWIGQRNYTGIYLAYDDFGGNCQNFASQCLYAGGLDMDCDGYSQWKFYSKTLNEYATAKGRSYSWTGVEPFFSYCRDNTSGGIVAHTDWGIAYTQKGDVIQVGAMGQWRHSVFVTDVIYDEDGYADEIIIASNTADRINYPLSAYIYTAPRLIHIIGQN